MTNQAIAAIKALAAASHGASSYGSLPQHTASQNALLSTMAGSTQATKEAGVSFSVVSSASNRIVIQDSVSKQRFSISSEAFTDQTSKQSTNLANNYIPKTGDTLLLVNTSKASITFRVIQASDQNPLPAKLSRTLANSWPDVSSSVISKAPLNIIAQSSMKNDDASAKALSKLIVQTSMQSGLPNISIPLAGKIVAIAGQHNSGLVQAIAALHLPTGDSGLSTEQLRTLKPLSKLIVPLQAKIANSVGIGTKVRIELSLGNALSKQKQSLGPDTLSNNNTNSGIIKTVSFQEAQKSPALSLDKLGIAHINKANPIINAKGISLLQALVLLPRVPASPLSQQLTSASQRSANQSGTADNLIALPLDKKNIDALPKTLLLGVSNTSGKDLSNLLQGRLLVSHQAANIGIAKNTGLSVLAVAKPISVTIDASYLSDGKTKNESSLKTSKTEIPTNKIPTGLESGRLNPNDLKLTNSAQRDSLLQSLKNTLTPQQILQLPPKLSAALNHTMAHTESGGSAFSQIKTVLESIDKNGSSDTKQNLSELLHAMRALKAEPTAAVNSGQNKLELAELLQSIMSAPAVTQIVNHSGTSFPKSNSFIEGLVSVLRLSLVANLSAAQNRITSTPSPQANNTAGLSNLLTSFIKPNTQADMPSQNLRTRATRLTTDIMQADPRASLIGEIGKLLSNHNSYKLRSADASLQGQDTYYYALPNLMNKNGKDIEFKIQREQQGESHKDHIEQSDIWKLDMRMDVGSLGTLLAKISLKIPPPSDASQSSKELDLHLYTSNSELKDKVIGLLPNLHSKLNAAGISVKSQKCDLGKIDESIIKTNLNVMHAYA
ncbi:hypothetical protein PN836_007425 [Ningiella sp. W23]|uniref:hypothetical protein n=1 Tax=Ningiella sp. W23 TaxID=3023715 RepID=UPI00375663B9